VIGVAIVTSGRDGAQPARLAAAANDIRAMVRNLIFLTRRKKDPAERASYSVEK
jgi:hypothetical protein